VNYANSTQTPNGVTKVFGQQMMSGDGACYDQLDCVFIRRVMLSPLSKILPTRANNNKKAKINNQFHHDKKVLYQ